jgi:hypothetical protein
VRPLRGRSRCRPGRRRPHDRPDRRGWRSGQAVAAGVADPGCPGRGSQKAAGPGRRQRRRWRRRRGRCRGRCGGAMLRAAIRARSIDVRSPSGRR